MEYKVLVGANPILLENLVKFYINSGWNLLGGASIAKDCYGNMTFAQTVIKGD